MLIFGQNERKASKERAEEGAGATIRHSDAQRGGNLGGWIQVAQIRPESRQEQPQPSV